MGDVIQFPPFAGHLVFGPITFNLNVAQHRHAWDATFTNVRIAMRLCEFDYNKLHEVFAPWAALTRGNGRRP